MYPMWDNYDKLLVVYYKFSLKIEVILECEVFKLSFAGPSPICFREFFGSWWILPFVFSAKFFLQPHFEHGYNMLAHIT